RGIDPEGKRSSCDQAAGGSGDGHCRRSGSGRGARRQSEHARPGSGVRAEHCGYTAGQAGRGKSYAAAESVHVGHGDGAGAAGAALGNRQTAGRIREREAWRRSPSEGIDQGRSVRASPSRHHVVAGYCGVAVTSAGNVVEVAVVAGTEGDGVDKWVEIAECRTVISHVLLIGQREIASPARRRVAGAAIFVVV